MIVEPAFEMYVACAEAAGLASSTCRRSRTSVSTRRGAGGDHAATRLIYLTDPNNPSGLPHPAGRDRALADAAPQAIVLVDEAYADFSGRTLIGDLLDRIATSSSAGRSRKRTGWPGCAWARSSAHPEALADSRVLPPFSINICAAVALAGRAYDRAYV